MAWESWYDLAIRELSDLSDPAKEWLAEVAYELDLAEDEEPAETTAA
jgi:hypothetical protein